MAEDTPSEVRSATSAVHATLVAAIVAAVLAAALSLALFWSFMSLPGVTDGLQALWVMPLTPAAAVVGGIAGAAMASLRSDRLPAAARVLSAAAVVVIYLPLAAMAFRVPWSTDVVVMLALAGVAVLVPVAVAANLQSLRTRPHPGRARAILALAAVGLCVVGPWGLAARAMRQEMDVVDAQWVEDVAVTPSGQIVVSTLAGVYVLGPEDRELRRAARPWAPGTAALIAAAQDDAGQLWAVAGAALWESDDWGAHWRKVRDIAPDFIESGKELVATQDAVYLAASDNVFYVRRSDGRGHWEEHAIPGYDPTCIAPSTEEPGTLIVGSYYGGALYRSRDYGGQWKELSVPAAVLGDRGLDVFDAIFVPGTPETLAVATAEQMLLSQDRGDTWTSQHLPEAMTTGEAFLAAAGEPSPRLYLATDVGVFASEDLCATWERLPLAAADEAGEMVLGLAVAPGNSDRVYAGLTDGLYRSTDGGRTWHRIPVAGERRGSVGSYAPSQEWEAVKFVDPGAGRSAGEYYDVDFVNARHGWVACSGADVGGRVIHTLDGGSTWTTQGISAILLDFVDENVGWAVGGARGELWRTVNGGATWTKTAADREMITNVAAVSEQEAWAIDGGILVHTVDGGESWRAVAHPLSENPTLLLEALCFLDRRHGWALGVQSGGMMPLPISVLRTADGGESFQAVRAPAVPTGNEPPFRMQFRSAMEGWAAVGGPSLLHTTDGGQTWRAVTPVVDGEKLEATYYDCSFVSPDQGWAVGSTGPHAIEGEALAVATSDGGRTWRRCTTGVEGVVHGMLRRVVFTDARHGWTAGRGGMWASDFPVQQEPTSWHSCSGTRRCPSDGGEARRMAEDYRRSAAGMVMDVVETAVLSALGAAGLAAVATAVITAVFALPPSATGPGPFWAVAALTAATGLGATAGAVLAARGRPVAPFPWIAAAAAGLAVNIGLGFVLGVRTPGFGVFFEYTSALTFVVLLPIAGAVTVHSLLRLRTRTVRGFTRVVLVVLAAGVGVVSYRGVAIPGVPLARGDFTRIAVATDGRLYLWTGKPTIETADPDRLEWQRLRPVPGARSVGFVLPVPEAPGYLVAGTGESLWQYTPATQQWGRVVEVIPGNAFTTGAAASHGIYIVDRFGSLHVMSSDRGNAWERRTIALVGKGRLTFQHIAVSEDRPGLVLGGCQYQNGLIRTTDYGDSWESLELPKEPGTSFVPSVHDIAFLPADPPRLLVLLNHGLFASSDGGETWAEIETPEDWLSGGELAVAATSPPTIYLHAGLDLYASDDLGKTWWNTGVHSISDRQGIITDIAVDPSSPSRAYAARTGSLHRTEDGGRTWSQIR